jgi:hypothetical protein
VYLFLPGSYYDIFLYSAKWWIIIAIALQIFSEVKQDLLSLCINLIFIIPVVILLNSYFGIQQSYPFFVVYYLWFFLGILTATGRWDGKLDFGLMAMRFSDWLNKPFYMYDNEERYYSERFLYESDDN